MVFFFVWQIKENPFFVLFFLCICCCSFERKPWVNFWKAINCCFSSMNWNIFILGFGNLLLYFLLHKLDLCFTCDVWCILNKIRGLRLNFLTAWFCFGVIAFGKTWPKTLSRSHYVKITETQNKNFKTFEAWHSRMPNNINRIKKFEVQISYSFKIQKFEIENQFHNSQIQVQKLEKKFFKMISFRTIIASHEYHVNKIMVQCKNEWGSWSGIRKRR